MKLKTTSYFGAALMALAITSSANAAFIVGDITFGGGVSLDTTSLGSATQVNTFNTVIALDPNGDFDTYVNTFDVPTFTAPWLFNSGAHAALWSIGGFTFDLASSTVVSQDNNFLNVKGVGILSGNGFTDTPGTWSFTISDSDGAPNENFRFGFTANTTAVPDGGTTVALLGFSLLGLHGVRRKFAKR